MNLEREERPNFKLERSDEDTIVADESVTLAIPNHTPTSPKGSVILGMALILGLLSGVGLAVWRDRLGPEPRRRLRDVQPVDLRFDQHFVGGLLAWVKLLCRRAHKLIQVHVLQRRHSMHERKGQESIASPEESDRAGSARAHAAYRRRRRGRRSELENIVGHQPPAGPEC